MSEIIVNVLDTLTSFAYLVLQLLLALSILLIAAGGIWLSWKTAGRWGVPLATEISLLLISAVFAPAWFGVTTVIGGALTGIAYCGLVAHALWAGRDDR